MDPETRENRERWNRLADAGIMFSKPFMDFTPADAERHVSKHGVIGEVNGLDVLCLAGGGGQDSVAFGLLGARVTVFDLSDTQLERDREAAAHHGLEVRITGSDHA